MIKSKKSLTTKFKEMAYEAFVRVNTIEIQIGAPFLQACILIYHLIFLLSTTQISRVLGFSFLDQLANTPIGFVIFPMYLSILTAVIAWYVWSASASSEDPRLLLFAIHMLKLYLYLIYPFTVWTLSNQLFLAASRNSSITDTLIIIFSSIIIVTGGTLVFCILMRRNNFWATFYLSCISAWTEIISYFSITIVQIAAASLNLKNTDGTKTLFYIFFNLILAMNLYSLLRQMPFWQPQASAFYIQLYFSVFLIKIFLESTSMGLLGNLMRGVICVGISNFAYKLAGNVVLLLCKIPVFQKGESTFKTYVGMVIMTYYIDQRPEDITKEEIDLFTFYRGQWQAFLVDSDQEDSDKSCNEILVEYMLGRNSKELWNVTMLLALTVTNPLPYLSFIFSLLSNFKKLTPSGFLGTFQYYQFKRLLEINLSAIYRGKILEDSERRNTVPNLFSNASFNLRDPCQSRIDGVDACRVFHWITAHNRIVHLSTHVIDVLSAIFNALSTGEGLNTANIYDLNIQTMNLDTKILREVSLVVSQEDSNIPSYIYPPIIFHLALIRNRIRKAETVYAIYKMKLKQLKKAFEKFDSQLTTEKVVFKSTINTVALSCSLEKTTLGKIVQSSLEAANFIGTPKSGDIVGCNIHLMIPKQIALEHSEIMIGTGLSSMLIAERSIFFNGFDEFLREGIMEVKIQSSLEKGILSAVLIRFSKDFKNTTEVLVDGRGVIISASQKFWEYVAGSSGKSPKSIVEVSSNLMSSLQLLLVEEEVRSFRSEKSIPEIVHVMQTCLTELKGKNEDGTLSYQANQGSDWEHCFLTSMIRSKIEICKTFRNPLAKIKFSFGSFASSNRDLQTNNLNQRPSLKMENELHEGLDRKTAPVSKQRLFEGHENALASESSFSKIFRRFQRAQSQMNRKDIVMMKHLNHPALLEAFNLMLQLPVHPSQQLPFESGYNSLGITNQQPSPGPFNGDDDPELDEELKLNDRNNKEEPKSLEYDRQKGFTHKTGSKVKITESFNHMSSPQYPPSENQGKEISVISPAKIWEMNQNGVEFSEGKKRSLILSKSRLNGLKQSKSIQEEENYPAIPVLKSTVPARHLVMPISTKIDKEKDIRHMLENLARNEKDIKVENQPERSEESYGTSQISGKRFYLRRVDALLESRSLTRDHMYPFMFGVLVVACTLAAYLSVGNLVKEYCIVNHSMFTMANSILKMDNSLQKTSVWVEAGYGVSVPLTLYDLSWPAFTGTDPAVLPSLLEIQNFTFVNHKATLKGLDFFKYFAKGCQAIASEMGDLLFEFETSSVFGGAGASVQNTVYKSKIDLDQYDSLQSAVQSSNIISFGTYFWNARILLSSIGEDFSNIETFYLGNSTTVGMTQVQTEILTARFRRVFQFFRTLTSGFLTKIKRNLRQLFEAINSASRHNYSKSLQISFGVNISVFLLVIIIFGILALKTQVRLRSLIGLYVELRPREIHFHRAHLAICSSMMKNFNLDEEKLVDLFLKPGKKNSIILSAQQKESVNVMPRSRTKKISMKTTKVWFINFGFMLGLILGCTAIFFSCMGKISSLNNKVENATKAEEFYFEAYVRILAVNENFFENYLLQRYGNFVSVTEKFPQDDNNISEIDNFISFLVDSEKLLGSYFDAKFKNKFQEMIHGSACHLITEEYVWHDLHRSICNEQVAPKKSVLAMLVYEKILIEQMRADVFRYTDTFLQPSKSSLVNSPMLMSLMSAPFLKYKATRYAVMEAFVGNLFKSIDSFVTLTLEDLLGEAHMVNLIMLILMILFTFIGSIAVNLAFLRSLKVALEIFRNILPDMLFHNHLVRSAFREHYHKKL